MGSPAPMKTGRPLLPPALAAPMTHPAAHSRVQAASDGRRENSLDGGGLILLATIDELRLSRQLMMAHCLTALHHTRLYSSCAVGCSGGM